MSPKPLDVPPLSPAVDGRDTKERLLDTAEQCFADHGFADTSLRTVTTAAGANLAAVHYHFGSKEALFRAVLARRIEPINAKRLRLLDELEAAGKPTAEQLVRAFVTPPLVGQRKGGNLGAVFMRLMGHASSDPNGTVRDMVVEQFQEVFHRFKAALQQALPQLSHEDIVWRVLFMAGAMVHTMAISADLGRFTGHELDPDNVDGVVEHLVAFVTGGLRAASPTPSAPTEGASE